MEHTHEHRPQQQNLFGYIVKYCTRCLRITAYNHMETKILEDQTIKRFTATNCVHKDGVTKKRCNGVLKFGIKPVEEIKKAIKEKKKLEGR